MSVIHKIRRLGLFVSYLCLAFPATAAIGNEDNTLKSFVPGSFAKIVNSKERQAFIIALWSLDCPPCLEELNMWASLRQQYLTVDIIFISTDTDAAPDIITSTLQKTGNKGIESWVFADDFIERLRFEIDPQWYGELPRTIFYA